jgi:hypothetical protein
MLAVALGLTSLGSLLVYILPKQSGMWISVVLLMVMSIGVFMGKAVMMAPIAELNLDESISGSAMSVGSFLAYASIFWAPIINAKFIEASYGPAQGYKYVFLTTVIVAAVGAICAVLLINYKKKAK